MLSLAQLLSSGPQPVVKRPRRSRESRVTLGMVYNLICPIRRKTTQQLADACGCAKSTVRIRIQELLAQGLILETRVTDKTLLNRKFTCYYTLKGNRRERVIFPQS